MWNTPSLVVVATFNVGVYIYTPNNFKSYTLVLTAQCYQKQGRLAFLLLLLHQTRFIAVKHYYGSSLQSSHGAY